MGKEPPKSGSAKATHRRQARRRGCASSSLSEETNVGSRRLAAVFAQHQRSDHFSSTLEQRSVEVKRLSLQAFTCWNRTARFVAAARLRTCHAQRQLFAV